MPQYVAFYLGLHCLPKYPFRVSCLQRVKHWHYHVKIDNEIYQKLFFICYIFCLFQEFRDTAVKKDFLYFFAHITKFLFKKQNKVNIGLVLIFI